MAISLGKSRPDLFIDVRDSKQKHVDRSDAESSKILFKFGTSECDVSLSWNKLKYYIKILSQKSDSVRKAIASRTGVAPEVISGSLEPLMKLSESRPYERGYMRYFDYIVALASGQSIDIRDYVSDDYSSMLMLRARLVRGNLLYHPHKYMPAGQKCDMEVTSHNTQIKLGMIGKWFAYNHPGWMPADETSPLDRLQIRGMFVGHPCNAADIREKYLTSDDQYAKFADYIDVPRYLNALSNIERVGRCECSVRLLNNTMISGKIGINVTFIIPDGEYIIALFTILPDQLDYNGMLRYATTLNTKDYYGLDIYTYPARMWLQYLVKVLAIHRQNEKALNTTKKTLDGEESKNDDNTVRGPNTMGIGPYGPVNVPLTVHVHSQALALANKEGKIAIARDQVRSSIAVKHVWAAIYASDVIAANHLVERIYRHCRTYLSFPMLNVDTDIYYADILSAETVFDLGKALWYTSKEVKWDLGGSRPAPYEN